MSDFMDEIMDILQTEIGLSGRPEMECFESARDRILLSLSSALPLEDDGYKSDDQRMIDRAVGWNSCIAETKKRLGL